MNAPISLEDRRKEKKEFIGNDESAALESGLDKLKESA